MGHCTYTFVYGVGVNEVSQEVTAPQEEHLSQHMREETTANTHKTPKLTMLEVEGRGERASVTACGCWMTGTQDSHVESRHSLLLKNPDDAAEQPPERSHGSINTHIRFSETNIKTFDSFTLLRYGLLNFMCSYPYLASLPTNWAMHRTDMTAKGKQQQQHSTEKKSIGAYQVIKDH